jgi:heme/copper-type cytochrome/quinol oxidase subunit 2
MTPFDVILWAVALLVVAIVVTLIVTLVIAVIRTARKPSPRTHQVIDSEKP